MLTTSITQPAGKKKRQNPCQETGLASLLETFCLTTLERHKVESLTNYQDSLRTTYGADVHMQVEKWLLGLLLRIFPTELNTF